MAVRYPAKSLMSCQGSSVIQCAQVALSAASREVGANRMAGAKSPGAIAGAGLNTWGDRNTEVQRSVSPGLPLGAMPARI